VHCSTINSEPTPRPNPGLTRRVLGGLSFLLIVAFSLGSDAAGWHSTGRSSRAAIATLADACVHELDLRLERSLPRATALGTERRELRREAGCGVADGRRRLSALVTSLPPPSIA
jgi:hypothetical protein